MPKNSRGVSKEYLCEIIAEKMKFKIKHKLQDVLSKEDFYLINDDDFFMSNVTRYLMVDVKRSIQDVVTLDESFDVGFEEAMYNIRDKLIVANDFSLDLSPHFESMLPIVLQEGFERVVEGA